MIDATTRLTAADILATRVSNTFLKNDSRTELRYKLIVFRQYRNTSRINFKIITEFWQDIGILIKPEWISKLEERKII